MSKPVIENFGLQSLKGGACFGRLNHGLDNTKTDKLSQDEKQERKLKLKNNFIITGTCKNNQEVLEKIKKAEQQINTNRNKYPLKEIVSTLNLPEEMKDNQEVKRDYVQLIKDFWESKGVRLAIGYYHDNETNFHVHLFFENWAIGKKSKKMKWGWDIGSLKPKDLKQIHIELDNKLSIFCEKWKLKHKDKKQIQAEKRFFGKHIDIWELKRGNYCVLPEFLPFWNGYTNEINILYKMNCLTLKDFNHYIKTKEIKINNNQIKDLNSSINTIKTEIKEKEAKRNAIK